MKPVNSSFLEPFMDLDSFGLSRDILTNSDAKRIMKDICKNIYGYDPPNTPVIEFPGSHPVTLLKKHIPTLLNKDYYVCEKSDGIRVFLYVTRLGTKSVCLFVDRKSKVYSINCFFEDFEGSLFDGELYVDELNNKKYYVYAIFDTILFRKNSVMEKEFLERLNYAKKFVTAVKKLGEIYVIVKEMYKCYGFCEVNQKIPTLKHKNDGMIFTPLKDPYIPGRCDIVYKWKPAHLNTVDFRIRRKENTNYVYYLMCFGANRQEVVFDIFVDMEMEIKDMYDDTIGEFSYDQNAKSFDLIDLAQTKGAWVLHKIRTDKTTPNAYKVVVNVIQSIKENISYEYLEKYHGRIRDNWKKREQGFK